MKAYCMQASQLNLHFGKTPEIKPAKIPGYKGGPQALTHLLPWFRIHPAFSSGLQQGAGLYRVCTRLANRFPAAAADVIWQLLPCHSSFTSFPSLKATLSFAAFYFLLLFPPSLACVTERNWLHIRSVSFTSTFASHFSCSLEGHCPYIKACLGEPSPSAWSLSQNPFVQDPEHLWMATGRKKLTHLLPRLAIPGDICEINGLFTLLPHLSLLYSIKEPGIQTPNGGYFETLPPSQSACFPNKSIFFASTPCSWLIGLLCGEQSKLGLSNT